MLGRFRPLQRQSKRDRRAVCGLALVGACMMVASTFAWAMPAVSTSTSKPSTRIAPDPSPMFERRQWVFDLRWDKGDVFLLGVHRVELPAPQSTPRAMGRFALELYEGPALIERVRFDFPLLGAAEAPDAGRYSPPSFEKKLSTRVGVMFPATIKGTRLELWDRATDKRWPLQWPPDEAGQADAAAPTAAGKGDAGSDGGRADAR